MVHPAFQLRGIYQTNPSQTLDGFVRQRLSSPPWHPKITPYRLVVLTTTIGLGTAKALLTQRGSSLAPIALEWITGTILFLLWFSLSAYDSGGDIPAGLQWLFKPDCMNLVWQLLESFSIQHASYVSDEKPTILNAHAKYPPITPYRILVCCLVTSFGLSKAILGYCGFSTAVTWVDWALAVPITTFLYLLGLYEYNSSNVWSHFFVADQSELFYSLNIGIKHTIGIFLSLAWTFVWALILQIVTNDPSWDPKTIPPPNYKITIRTRIDYLYRFALKSFVQELYVVAIVAGIAAFFIFSAYIVRDVTDRGGLVRAALRILCRPIVRLVAAIIPSPPEESLRTRRPSGYSWEKFVTSMGTARRVLVHVGLHLFGIIFGLTFAMCTLGFTATMVDLVQSNEVNALQRLGCVYMTVVGGCGTLGCIFCTLQLLPSLLNFRVNAVQ